MTSDLRKKVYLALGLLNAALLVCVQQNAFANAPHVAYGVALASGLLAAFMHAWGSPDADVIAAALSAAANVKPAPEAPKDPQP